MKSNQFVSIGILVLFSLSVNAAETEIEARIALDPFASPQDIYRTLQLKANRLCRVHTVRPYDRPARQRQCIAEFMDDAVIAIRLPELTALHVRETGRRPVALAASDDRNR